MLNAVTLLLLFQLAGEAIALFFKLPVPGPVIGMALLFAALARRGGPSPELRETAQNLLQHFSLLFVPAGVGVTLHFQRMADEWLPILVALVASTFITIAVSALVLRALTRHEPAHADTERQR
ncbi:MAG: CidA/LrgA family protein [Sulfuritalea sp.]|nr:CidA/LrgA family protein [Sulfuritalea sp.]